MNHPSITTSFGRADLKHFWVDSSEIDANGELGPCRPRRL
jgi:hypothetical protein